MNQLRVTVDKNTKPSTKNTLEIDSIIFLVIEFEDAVEEFLGIQRTLQDKMKGFVKDIFNAADVT